ncbi:MAG: DUF4255 domain-containing protein, partial [Bacteroidota bacterium]
NPKNIIISLVNIEEESALKNNPYYRTPQPNGQVDYHNPPIYINLYMLVTANHLNYQEALRKLSMVMQFFQSRKKFTVSSAFNPLRTAGSMDEIDLEFSDEESAELQVTIDLYTLTFEQVNHLWGALGGKQLPFVMYVVRLVKIEDQIKQGGGQLIQNVQINES